MTTQHTNAFPDLDRDLRFIPLGVGEPRVLTSGQIRRNNEAAICSPSTSSRRSRSPRFGPTLMTCCAGRWWGGYQVVNWHRWCRGIWDRDRQARHRCRCGPAGRQRDPAPQPPVRQPPATPSASVGALLAARAQPGGHRLASDRGRRQTPPYKSTPSGTHPSAADASGGGGPGTRGRDSGTPESPRTRLHLTGTSVCCRSPRLRRLACPGCSLRPGNRRSRSSRRHRSLGGWWPPCPATERTRATRPRRFQRGGP